MNAMRTMTQSTSSDKTRARLLALAMHAAFILLIVFGVSWQKKPTPPVEAELWSNLPPLPQPKVEPPPAAQPAPEPPPPPPKPAPRVETPPPAPKLVPVPLKPDIAIKKVEKEKPPPKAALKPEVRDEPKPEPKQRVDDTAARLEREQEAQREQAAREAKAAADKAAAEKAAAARAAQAAAASDTARYIGGIRAKVWARVALPADLQGNPEAEFMVSLLPGGELENVSKIRGSGNDAYDAAVERAIRQAQPFAVPSGDEFQRSFRRIRMTFRPR